ncbi:MAG: ribose-5-phosphate isomerase RpiA [Planctomycetes bacterium]|nr:ribose-5-phosphate isomerase RpiA [Planctomycetota bacterium]MCB9905086.1 ribose-5-phosphate isomerase RpiA [Planctomycetota bacterium]
MTNAKQAAGRRAAELVEDGMTVGLGTGSTVFFTLQRLAERIRDEGISLRGVPTSLDTESKAREFGIPLATLDEVERIALTIDGADEIDGDYQMIKGGGGALLREKVVATISDRVVTVVGRDKLVERLGTTFLLPVEVVPFARATVRRAIKALGGEPTVRLAEPERPFVTDNGNQILDCKFEGGIADARALAARLSTEPGVVEHGLFIDLATDVVIGDDTGTAELRSK